MSLNNLKMILDMSLNKDVLNSLITIYNIFKDDKNFNIVKYIKMMISILKKEKIIKFENTYVISTFLPPFPSKAFETNAIAVNGSEDIFTKQVYARRSGPISIYLCITNKCPNNCLYCSAKNRKDEEELSTTEIINLIKDIQSMNVPIIGITGGEPMVREDIYDIIKSVDKKSIPILFTSGFNLTLDRARDLKNAGLFSIGISLDSHDETKHNVNRKSSEAFKYAISALENANKAGLYTMAQTVVLKEDIDEENLFNLFKLAKNHGAHEVKILEPILSGNLLNSDNLDKILYTNEDRLKLIDIQHRANKISNFPKITTFAYTESEEKFGCGAGTQHSYISANGDLYPCDFVPMNFGNIRNENIKKLWLDMNNDIGIPKIGCFAQRINKEVYKKSMGNLPLNTSESRYICKNNKCSKFPKYYRDLQ